MLIPVTSLPRASLARVLEEVGTTLLDVVCGDVERADDIGGIVIHDPLDEPELPKNALVMGVGLYESADIARVVTHLGRHGAAALVVRAPVEPDERLVAAARASGVAVLSFARGASWTHLAGMLRTLTAESNRYDTDSPAPGRVGSGDLFAVANAIAALLDAPVTIEDRNSRLLAFSSRQEEVDPSRVQTILGRQVPEHYTRILEERGVFQAIYRSDRPVFVDSLPESDDSLQPPELPRAAIAVRAGDEILGTIWVVVPEALSAERSEALYEASKLVAMHMVWQRADADMERRLRAELLGTALESGPGSPEAVRRLGLKDEPAVVLALTVVDAATEHRLPARLATERKRLTDAFAMHLSAVHPRATAALIGDVAYGILPLLPQNRQDAEERAAWIATEFLARVGSRLRPLIGVGQLAADSSALARSRSGAERALRVLRSKTAGQQVARLDDIHVEALLLELADLVPRGDIPSGAVARIVAYDETHQASLVETLRSWLDAFGDVAVASAAMFVHPNTFRYRLRRAAEVGRIDLNDPNARLSAMLQLRLMSLRSAPDG
ncbi:PucR family transcriptional regulator [Streptomyces albipurpureus]|uniref:Helix-turn-helix domain-containing protein n=1 Tax=Streptomyces albipurpureus TaxID=2897419 RepID=A0ABT0UVS3_9ACTN|nr:PucR family transcriptional regulator [Streptomyces sp. CWNU-1]MCM2392064.1 helix-turn-helix domain-containing protein [Streptomyces sp. CWNU-1]